MTSFNTYTKVARCTYLNLKCCIFINLHTFSTRCQPEKNFQIVLLYLGESHVGDVLGGHKVTRHTGHYPGEQQGTPFFRLLFEGRKTHQNSVFRFFCSFLYFLVKIALLVQRHSQVDLVARVKVVEQSIA
jgi:hypothetical protein